MSLAHRTRLKLRSIFRARKVESELNEELQFHLENKIAEARANGLSEKEARQAALRAMDGLEQQKERARDTRGIHWLTDFIDDLRYAIRSLHRTLGLTAFVVLTLALGIGMVSGTFSMLDALVLRPYPVPHPGAVLTLVSTTHENSYGNFSYREYLDLRDKTKSYDGVLAYADMQAVSFSANPGATPRVKGGMLVSGNFFASLGVEPRFGRSFRPDEDHVPGRDPVVVLGPAFWRHEFASDPTVLGRKVRLNGVDFTVIGVAPDSFSGLQIFGHPDFYLPLAMAHSFSTNPQKNFLEDRDDRELNVKARLKPGVTLQQARSELSVLAKNFASEYPKLNRDRGAAVHTSFEMRTRADDINWKFGLIFVILALSVLLVACTNVTGLLLSRARSRTREIAVRLAIGAGRFRIIRLLLTESLILALLGGLGGGAIGYGIVQWFHSYQNVIFMTDLPASVPFAMDTRALLVCLALALLSALLCGLAPALQSTRADLVHGLKSADVDLPGRKRLWGRNLLVVAQVAASLMLLTASFLMIRGFQHGVLESSDMPKDHLLMTTFDPRLMRYTPAQTRDFYKTLIQRVRSTPGVRSATLTQNIPLGPDDYDFDSLAFVPEGFVMPRDRQSFTTITDTVDDGYFDTMRISLLHGRAFRASDDGDTPRVAVVNQQFAQHYWPNADAIGKRIRLERADGDPVEIIGVAQTIKYQATTETPSDFIYLPLAQHPVTSMTVVLRSNDDPLQLLAPLRDVVRSLDPNLPMLMTRTYEDYYINRAIKGPSIAIKLVGAMGVVGMLLAVAGLYGLVAYNVSRRTREIGIRMAIGANRSDVLRLIMGKGLVLVAIGIALGLAMGMAVERLMNAMLFDSGGVDLVVYATLVPAMLAITAAAAYIPARKATQIPPTQALRYE